MIERPGNKYKSKDREGNRVKETPDEKPDFLNSDAEQKDVTENPTIAQSEKKEKKKQTPSAPKINRLTQFKAFAQDAKTQKITGIVLLLFAAYLLIAFTSFIFTWQTDQNLVMGPLGELFSSNEIKVDNWLGKVGAVLSHFFIYSGFGIASFLFVFNFFNIGLFLYRKFELMPIKKTVKSSLFFLLWVSFTLAYFFNDNLLFLGGVVGFQVNNWLNAIVGSIGTLLLLISSLVIYFVVNFNFSLFSSKSKADELIENETSTEQLIEDENLAIKNVLKDKTLANQAPSTESNFTKENVPEPILKKVEPVLETTKKPEIELTITENKSTDFVVENKVEEIKINNSNTEAKLEEVVIEKPIPEALPNEISLSTEVTTTTILSETKDGIDFLVEKSENTEETNNVAGETIVAEDKELEELAALGDYDPTLELSSYLFPPIDLMEDRGNDTVKVNNEELQGNKDKILATLKNYNIDIQQIKATIGPTVTLYEIVPAPGVRISKIKNLEDDIALSLSALGIRIIAPIPGKGTIGIEVPNQNPEMVPMRSVLLSEKFQNSGMDLPVALGKTITGETFVADLAKMPHLLMAGSTGQGKSVGLNCLLVSLLYKKHPSQVKFVLVDPKKVELTLFNIIERHFLAKLPDTDKAIITDTKKVVNTLNSLCLEMDARYELLEEAMVRNIKEYNAKFISRRLNPQKGHKYLPYIVVVIDEFADFIMTAGKEVETPIARIAQLARAVGIHLIIATQRPAVNIITGNIKANFPARIAFRVASKIDSRTILDSGGAEQLIGKGDMLFSNGNDLIRIQCAFVDTPEVERVAEFIGSQRGYPNAFMLPEVPDTEGEGGTKDDFDPSQRDAFFEEAARLIVQHQQGSTSLIQRRLKLGYNRAGRIIDQLEAYGIVGQFSGSKAREVLIKDEASLEQKLQDLK
ncbi:MAG: DNA translocase FtsK [Bacteroidota bacterium]